MAKTQKTPAKEQAKAVDKTAHKKGHPFLIIVVVLLLLIFLAGVGFAAGVYLKFIDLPQIAQNLKLYNYPVIGQYFPQPATNFQTVKLPPSLANKPITLSKPPVLVTPVATTPLPTGSEKEKMLQEAKEQNKRISKLARLYGDMKPAEAVDVLNLLDDDTVISILNKMDEDQVAKILAKFDPQRTARLTQSMLKGKIISL